MIEVSRPNREERRRSGKSDPLDAIEAARVARTAALVQMRQLIVTAPDQLRSRLRGLTVHTLATEAARLHPARHGDPVVTATKASLCALARRVRGLDDELAELDARIGALLWRFGVGPDTAAVSVVCDGDSSERLHSEPAWAHLCGVAPAPAGSGKTSGRVRVDHAGDRQANAALWRIGMVRMPTIPRPAPTSAARCKKGAPSTRASVS